MAARDPVCGRDVDELRARAVAIFGKRTYYFCSAEHKAEFVREPARYLDSGAVPVAVGGERSSRSGAAERSAKLAAEKSAKLAAAAEKSAKVAAEKSAKVAAASEKSAKLVDTMTTSAPPRVAVEEASIEAAAPIAEREPEAAPRAGGIPRWMIVVVAVVIALGGVALWLAAKR